MSTALSDYLTRAHRILAAGQALFPETAGAPRVTSQTGGIPPAGPLETSATARGVDAAAVVAESQCHVGRSLDHQLNAALEAAHTEAHRGWITATNIRNTAQVQAASLAPMMSSPAGARLMVSALDAKLAAMQLHVTGSRERSEAWAAGVGRLADDYHSLGRTPPPASPQPPDTIPVRATAEEVKKWWDSLTADQKNAQMRDHPDEIGNLDGIPVADRATANHAVMTADLDRVTKAAAGHLASVDDVVAHPLKYGLDAIDIVRYRNAIKVAEGLEHNRSKTGADTLLLTYQPSAFNGQGRAAIAINNPDKAINTALLVPGTGHSVAEGWLSADDAVNLYTEMSRNSPVGPSSVIAWMGYDAPDGLDDPRVASTPPCP